MERDSCVVYKSWFDSIEKLPQGVQLDTYRAIFKYAFEGRVDENGGQLANAMLTAFKPQIDLNNKRYLNGCKGGAPHGNTNALKDNALNNQNNQKQPKTTKNNQKQPNVYDYVYDDVYVEKERVKEKAQPAKRFVPPTLEEVKAYIQEKGYSVDAEKFISHYESNGWMVGRNKMKKWQAAVVNWQKSEPLHTASPPSKQTAPYKRPDDGSDPAVYIRDREERLAREKEQDKYLATLEKVTPDSIKPKL